MPISFFKHLARPDHLQMNRFEVPDHLKPFVEGFYVLDNDRCIGKQLFFNDGYPVLAFMRARNERTRLIVDGEISLVENAWFCGGILKNVYCESSTAFRNMFVIRFHPMTFFGSFGLEENYFTTKQVVNFSEIAGAGFAKLNNAFYDTTSTIDRMQLISEWLAKRMNRHYYPELLTDILHSIEKRDTLSVKGLLNDYSLRLNYKWLERNFKRHVGMSPKEYISIRRFLKAYLDLHSSGAKDLLQVALDHGYYDDNHFIKDFRRFSGVPPKTYFQNFETYLGTISSK